MDSNSTMNFHRAYSTRVEAITTVAIFTAKLKFECAERWRFRSTRLIMHVQNYLELFVTLTRIAQTMDSGQ